ncbi:MAG: hypothetical protein ACTSUZ_00625 [Candidatus Thorarchaeota archaeon]
MLIIEVSLACVLLAGWAFLVFSLKRQIRYATLLVDMLPLYPLVSLMLAIIVSLVGFLLLQTNYGLSLFCISIIPNILLAHRFYKWGKSYRWKQYREFLVDIKDTRYMVRLFEDYQDLKANQSAVSVFIRHDVDISLPRVLKMMKIEKEMGIVSTYFFRMHAERYTFEEAIPIIKQLHNDGFGIGFHYDVFSYTKGNKEKSLALFQEDLAILREIAPIHFVCAHGDTNYRNQNIWADIDHETLQVQSVYDLERDMYISDAGGRILIDSQGRHSLKKIEEAQPGQVIQVLIHPDWWF